MKYAVIDQTTGDWFEEFFDTKQEAINRADIDWNTMSQHDKNRRTAFYVASAELDEDCGYKVIDVIKDYM